MEIEKIDLKSEPFDDSPHFIFEDGSNDISDNSQPPQLFAENEQSPAMMDENMEEEEEVEGEEDEIIISGEIINNKGDDDLNLIKKRKGGRAPNPHWSPKKDQLFISLVRANPCLYNRNHQDWRGKIREVVWKEISEKVGVPASECKRHFKHMRDSYVRYQRTGRGKTTALILSRSLDFLANSDAISHRTDKKDNNPSNDSSCSLDLKTNLHPITPSPSSSISYAQNISKSPDIIIENIIGAPVAKPGENVQIISKAPLPISFPYSSKNFTFQSSQGSILPHFSSTPKTHRKDQNSSSIPSKNKSKVREKEEEDDDEEIGSKSKGANHFFGQYIASVLDSLPEKEVFLIRHKVQEVLFNSQTESYNDNIVKSIQFQCYTCSNVYKPT